MQGRDRFFKSRDLVSARDKNKRIIANYKDFKKTGEVVYSWEFVIKNCLVLNDSGEVTKEQVAFRKKCFKQ